MSPCHDVHSRPLKDLQQQKNSVLILYTGHIHEIFRVAREAAHKGYLLLWQGSIRADRCYVEGLVIRNIIPA